MCSDAAHGAVNRSGTAAGLLARTRTRGHPRHKVRAYLAHPRRSKQMQRRSSARDRAGHGRWPGRHRGPAAQPEAARLIIASTQNDTAIQPNTRPAVAIPSPSSRLCRI
ncbi:hypothetical protein GCM10020229_44660 [Kitasatospora albolonga]